MIDRPRTLFKLPLSLFPQKRDIEESWVSALWSVLNVGAFDGVLLEMPCRYEVENPLESNLVRCVMSHCSGADVDLFYGPNVWVAWEDRSKYKQRLNDVFSPAYYAAYLAHAHAVAKGMGAKGTFAVTEPYGDSPYGDSPFKQPLYGHPEAPSWFKKSGFDPYDRCRVMCAIKDARNFVSGTTMAKPAGGQHETHFSWALRHLGDEYLFSKSYQWRKPGATPVTAPSGEVIKIHWWGSWVAIEPVPGEYPLTFAEHRALPWDDIRAAHPELLGTWLSVSDHDILGVLKQLGEDG